MFLPFCQRHAAHLPIAMRAALCSVDTDLVDGKSDSKAAPMPYQPTAVRYSNSAPTAATGARTLAQRVTHRRRIR